MAERHCSPEVKIPELFNQSQKRVMIASIDRKG